MTEGARCAPHSCSVAVLEDVAATVVAPGLTSDG